MAKIRYVEEWLTHNEMVEKMEEEVMRILGIPLKFIFELAGDGNLDLYIKNYTFTREELKIMMRLGWLHQELQNELDYSGEVSEPLLEYLSYPFNQSHQLFVYVLEKTFGKNAKVIDTEIEVTHVNLKIEIPIKSKLFKNTSLI